MHGAKITGLAFFLKVAIMLLFATLTFKLSSSSNPKSTRENMRNFTNLQSDFIDVYQTLVDYFVKDSKELVIADQYFNKAMFEINAMLFLKKEEVGIYSKAVVFESIGETADALPTLSPS